MNNFLVARAEGYPGVKHGGASSVGRRPKKIVGVSVGRGKESLAFPAGGRLGGGKSGRERCQVWKRQKAAWKNQKAIRATSGCENCRKKMTFLQENPGGPNTGEEKRLHFLAEDNNTKINLRFRKGEEAKK